MTKTDKIGFIERLGTGMDWFRVWTKKSWRIGVLMAKGAYIVGERRRLFVKLGEEVYKKVGRGELRDAELEPLVQQLERLTKKVEIEEILIRNIRFGSRSARGSRAVSPNTSKETA